MKFENLTAEDVECRIATVKENGVSLLLYKDARCDMRLLDNTVGSMNWQRKHEFKDGRLYCSVGIWDEKKQQWIWKEDVGTESYAEKEKGQASDSFKRACFNWGIGRELYTAPFIWIPSNKATIKMSGSRPVCYDKFIVTKMAVENGVITDLVITKSGGGVAFKMNNTVEISGGKSEQPNKITERKLTENQVKRLYAIASDCQVSIEKIKSEVKRLYKKDHLNEMTKAEYDRLIENINKTKQAKEKTA